QYHRPGESRHLSEDSESRTLAKISLYVALNRVCVLRQSCSRELSAMLAPPTNALSKVSGRLSSAAAMGLRERAPKRSTVRLSAQSSRAQLPAHAGLLRPGAALGTKRHTEKGGWRQADDGRRHQGHRG